MHATATANTNEVQLDDPEMGATWFYSIVGIVFFIVFVLAVAVLFFVVQTDYTVDRVVEARPALSTGLRNEQQGLLGAYGTYETPGDDDKPIEHIRIPIDEAIRLMAK